MPTQIINSDLSVLGKIKQTLVTSALVKADATGNLVPAIVGTDYLLNDTNFANADLVATGDRSHNFGNYNLAIGGNLWGLYFFNTGASSVISTSFNIKATSNSNIYFSTIKTDNLTATRIHQVPNVAGTFALSVNGVASDANGAITIPVGTNNLGTVTSVGLTSTDITVGGSSPITSSGTYTLTLPNINSNIGTFNNVTVNAKGQVTAASNQPYITGNQTITLTGHVTGSGTTSIATTIANNVVDNTKLADIVGQALLGRYSTGTGDPQYITIGTGLALNSTTGVLSATNTAVGTVTSINVAGSGALTFTGGPITTSGTISAGWSGSTAQYIRGDGTLATFPAATVVNDATLTMATSGIATGSQTFTANSATNKTFTVNVPSTLSSYTNDAGFLTSVPNIQQVLNIGNSFSSTNIIRNHNTVGGTDDYILYGIGVGNYSKIQGINDYANNFSSGLRFITHGTSSGSGAELLTLTLNNGFTIFNQHTGVGTRMATIAADGTLGTAAITSGTVTSVGLSMPTGFTVSNSPVTSSGTLAVTTTLNGNLRGNGTGFVVGNVNLNDEVTSILKVVNGGTGVATITGVMIGNGTSAVTGVTGTANQYLRRNPANTAYEFAAFPAIPTVNNGTLTMAVAGGILSGSATFTANQAGNSTFTVTSPGYGTTAGTIAQGNDSRFHNAVTIGTANGLSLSTQVLSLGLASTSTTGALSSTDWNTFNNKAPSTGGTGYIQNQFVGPQSSSGAWVSGVLSANNGFEIRRNLSDNVNRRNWSLTGEVVSEGDFHLFRSTTNTGAPNISTMSFDYLGNVKFPVLAGSGVRPVGAAADGTLQIMTGSTSTNLANSNLTQTDATRTYNMGNKQLIFEESKSFEVVGSNGEYFGISNDGLSNFIDMTTGYSHFAMYSDVSVNESFINLQNDATFASLAMPSTGGLRLLGGNNTDFQMSLSGTTDIVLGCNHGGLEFYTGGATLFQNSNTGALDLYSEGNINSTVNGGSYNVTVSGGGPATFNVPAGLAIEGGSTGTITLNTNNVSTNKNQEFQHIAGQIEVLPDGIPTISISNPSLTVSLQTGSTNKFGQIIVTNGGGSVVSGGYAVTLTYSTPYPNYAFATVCAGIEENIVVTYIVKDMSATSFNLKVNSSSSVGAGSTHRWNYIANGN